MLFPKKVKHRKWQTARRNPKKPRAASRGVALAYGSFGLKTLTEARVEAKQIEAARRVVSRTLGKTGKMWIRIFPDRPFTTKPAEVGMGKGKGDIQGYQAEVLPGSVIFEIDGVAEKVAREAFRKAAAKLPIKGKVISR